jgi:hypothetical protein
VLISLPTVMYGGYALLELLSKEKLTEFQRTYFRAGHAHAGVLTILSLLGQILVDAARLSPAMQWLVRVGMPAAGILISAGFFVSMLPPTATEPSRAIALVYAGAALLAGSVLSLGVGLLRAK